MNEEGIKVSASPILVLTCYAFSFGEHVTPIGRVPGWRIGEGLPYLDGRREIKYLSRMHAASVLIVSSCFYHCLVVR